MKRSLPVLPPMRCDDDCGDCCGPVAAIHSEYDAIIAYAREHDIQPRDQGALTCPWLHDLKCAVYPVRPLLCRAFGHSKRLKCSRGYNVNVDERRLRRHIGRAIKDQPYRMLHEVLRAT